MGADRVQDLWHLYSDSTYFKYNVHLTRDDPEHGWHGQRYELYVSCVG